MKKLFCLSALVLVLVAACAAQKVTTDRGVRSNATTWERYYESIPGDSTVTYYPGGFDVTGNNEAYVFFRSVDTYPVHHGLLLQYDLAPAGTLSPWRVGVAPDSLGGLSGEHGFWLTVNTTVAPFLMFVEDGEGPFEIQPTDRPYILLKDDGTAEYGVNYGAQKPFYTSQHTVSSKESYRVIAYTATQSAAQVVGLRNATVTQP